MREFDLVIVGGGLAGLTAAMYAGRYGLSTAVVDQMGAGGQIVNVEKVENFPGFPEGVPGFDLGPLVQEQAEAAGADFVMDTVESMEIDGDKRVLRCAEEELQARAVIIAAGSSLRVLGIPGEERLMGKGVSHCASCDAPFFVGQETCVIGGGDSALDEAAVLAEQVARVLVIHRGPDFQAQQVILDKVAAMGNIEPVFNTRGAGDTWRRFRDCRPFEGRDVRARLATRRSPASSSSSGWSRTRRSCAAYSTWTRRATSAPTSRCAPLSRASLRRVTFARGRWRSWSAPPATAPRRRSPLSVT